MSDSKWVKLLKALAIVGNEISSCKVKLIWDDDIRDLRIDSDIMYAFDFYHNSMEAMVSGYPTGFYDYKELEWIELSSSEDSIEVIAERISSVGRFEIEHSPKCLRLYAYK